MTDDLLGASRTTAVLRNRDTIVLLLAAAGAGVDAAMLVSFGVLTAAQTGNTILLAVALAQGRWRDGLAAGISVTGYVLGAAAGELIIDAGNARRGEPRFIARALVVELLLLILVVVGWWLMGVSPALPGQDGLIALAAIAMGMQSAATLRLHAGPATTYVTGTLTTFTTEMIRRSRRLSGFRAAPGLDPTGTPLRVPDAQERPWMYGLTWGVYLAAAIATALLGLQSPQAALLLPICVLAVVVATARVSSRPLSSPELNRPKK